MIYLACLIAVFLGYGIACLFGDEQRAYCLGYREGYTEGQIHGRLEGRIAYVYVYVRPVTPPPLPPELLVDDEMQALAQPQFGTVEELDYHA